jgi:hypothetical protein
MSTPRDWVRLARPRQWLKNGFVLIGAFFARAWNDPALVLDAGALFVAFCLVSSAVYVFNDVIDREADRAHPDKRSRPVAAGAIGPGAALAYCMLLAATGLALGALVSAAALRMAGAYIALNLCYSLGLKHVAVLDVLLIAAGFMLRLLAGTVGLGIAPSRWLLLCGVMVTLFLGFSKRRAELASLNHGRGALEGDPGAAPSVEAAQRRSLNAYSLQLLDAMIAVSAAGTVIGYALYTIDERTVSMHATDDLAYTVPLVLYGTARYLWVLYRRDGGADPSAELIRDPHLVAALVAWLALTGWLIA